MYIQGMAQQTQVFLLCAGFGFVMGAVYDVIRLFRKSFFHGYKSTAVQDIMFFVICTFCTFLFMLCANDGEMRLYPYLGSLAGFFIWYFTFGVLVSSLFNRLSMLINRIFMFVLEYEKKICKKTAKNIKKIINKTSKPLEKSINSGV